MTSTENIKDSSRPDLSEGGLIACHECDLLHKIEPVPVGGKALCTRCGALLYRNIPNSIERALALNLAGLMFFVMANVFPFISLKLSGRVEENVFLSGAIALYRLGMGEVGLLVIFTSFLFPLLTIAGMLYILLPLKFGHRPWKMAPVYRMVRSLAPWNLLAVFMLGVLIAIVKLLDLATIIPGISLYSFVGLMVVSTAAHANMDPSVIWSSMKIESAGNASGATAAERGLIGCHTCALLVPKTTIDEFGHGDCPRCGTSLHSRKTNSLARTWALIFSATLLYIPANVYPVMTVIRFGQGHPNTILSGVVHLIEGGMWVLAMIIFFASIVVPVLKLIVLSFLLITIKKKSSWRSRDRTHLFRVTEGVGAWSMVDIYVVAVLAGLVNLGALSTIRPGIGVAFFAAVVVITMLAAHSFDPRLIWDNTERAR
ncbi:MAG: paraquat-inducible protein A [Deltaproteobacteria bacterium]|nr:paraquat-inducible protein A [Deltaproteobacteria bacterium]MBW2342421.1 paraquat-inducible protein A [Deltaproteobacteria bacterium]